MSKIPPFDPDLDGPTAKYVRLADHIEALISAGELKPNARLQSERDQIKEYHVSYGTVRSAARVLRERGLIKTSQGRGTYVLGPETTDTPDISADDEGDVTEG